MKRVVEVSTRAVQVKSRRKMRLKAKGSFTGTPAPSYPGDASHLSSKQTFYFQFGISGAAVARVWADKILEWVMLANDTGLRRFWVTVLNPIPSLGVSPLAAALQMLCVMVLLRGVTMGKRVTTVLTAVKVGGEWWCRGTILMAM